MSTTDTVTVTSGKTQRTTMRGHDELAMTDVLERFTPAPTEDMHKWLSSAAKGYWNSDQEWATAEPIEGLYPVTISRHEVENPNKPEGVQTIAHEQVVPVFVFTNRDKTEGFYALIHRTHEERSFRRTPDGKLDLSDDGKARWWDTYLCSYLSVPDADEAKAVLSELRSAMDFVIARALAPAHVVERPVGADDVAQAAVELAGANVTSRPRRRT